MVLERFFAEEEIESVIDQMEKNKVLATTNLPLWLDLDFWLTLWRIGDLLFMSMITR
jgi:hypothetical protein